MSLAPAPAVMPNPPGTPATDALAFLTKAAQANRPLAKDASTSKILIVDDEPINIKVVQKFLRHAGYEQFVTTSDSREAMDLVRREKPDVIVLDIVMPHITGLAILEQIRGDVSLSHLPVLILTANDDSETRQYALELGATDFLTKPVRVPELIARVRNALVVKAHHDHLAAYSARLEDEIRKRTLELAQSRREVIQVLACAAEYRDQDTGYHVVRVGKIAGIISQQLGMKSRLVELMEQAAVLHDVGKIGIPDAILLKPGKLDADEIKRMQHHCEYGMNILRCIPTDVNLRSQLHAKIQLSESPVLQLAASIAISHHEKWDGSGYPKGLSGEMIPIEGRITAVADVFDALSSRRPYKKPLPLIRCCEILEEGRGTHFDPKVLDAFFLRIADIVKVVEEFAD